MLQLRMLRKFTPRGSLVEKIADRPFTPDITAGSAFELFQNIGSVVEQIPNAERFNCYYTLAHTPGGQKRDFTSQDVLGFDIDHISLDPAGLYDKRYLDIVFSILGVHKNNTAVVMSGNGLQIILALKNPIEKKEYFKENKKYYDLICNRLDAAFKSAGLAGGLDKTIFDPLRIFRLPGTINRKVGKPERLARLDYLGLEPCEFSLIVAAGGEGTPTTNVVEPKADGAKGSKPNHKAPLKEIPPKSFKRLKIDSPAVLSGCEFLKWQAAHPAAVTEPQWHAMISVVARLEGGRATAHELSKGHPTYSAGVCDQKVDFALAGDVGPRTCANIETLWDGCPSCPHYNKKIASPLFIAGEEFIASAENGFYTMGEKGKLEPDYVGLRKQFQKETQYRVRRESGAVYTYDGQKFTYHHDNELRNYAADKFCPEPKEHMVREFVSFVTRKNLVDSAFFDPRGMINFLNGTLETGSGVFREHRATDGFLNVLPFDYEAGARSLEFDEMMVRVSCGDLELERMLLEFSGYAICDTEYWIQKAMILVGDGANGKSTFLDIVKALVGSGNFSVLGIHQLNDETARSQLEGKVVNISEEMPAYNMKNTENFKKVMGGEISIRNLYQNAVVIRNRAKFIFACNEVPSTFDQSHGMFRRVLLVPFNARFEESKYDHGLKGRLMKELPGIFNRFYAAWRDLKARGVLPDSAASRAELENYRQDLDIIGSWAKEHLEWEKDFGHGSRCVAKADLYAEYRNYCLQSGLRAVSILHFNTSLKRTIPEFKERNKNLWVGKKQVKALQGVWLAGQGDTAPTNF